MRISKLILMSLAAVVWASAQAVQAPDGSGVFQHLPPMLSHLQPTPTPVKTLPRTEPVGVHAPAFSSTQCAVPLMNVTPDDSARYTLRKVVPQDGQVGKMVYVTAAPTCGDAVGAGIEK